MKKEIVYNKLVRDRIPEIIEKENKVHAIHTATDEEYISQLYEKVIEELNEFKENPSEEEMADILEVLAAISSYFRLDEDTIQQVREKKNEKRGKFDKRIILEKVIE
ncbi:MAG: hypothetical protein K0R93_674 [Anaerosolibacter sp.]|jgi:predicted house-cleaning noncanonical NTP pyrophosphatase (MazG superfamily)|uniref:nucleoside triphosphate pyrophosphohydrolase n=1 Tax=Anaerosolibacter sp. TaxID=1872527 RepID=UPI0026234335|nr:nucleoside triphosphate pyrophosphohydrolase [Anaerosolibacter sp.]MDF2545776.1 hypothetical protein [Anaerosolibacter sp.]